MQKTSNTYWQNITSATRTLVSGLRLTLSHIAGARKSQSSLAIQDSDYFSRQVGIATVQYPRVQLPVPDVGRYQLHNEIDDCIVCDKCAKICPVDCITIEPIKSPEEIGKTSDGTTKRIYAAKFDIDMGKCCFCGLCTTVCPTECLTMTKTYDFSVFDISNHIFPFAEMTPGEIEEKKMALEAYDRNRQAKTVVEPSVSPPKVIFKPKIRPTQGDPDTTS